MADLTQSDSIDLVVRAFAAAKNSGKDDWHRMTSAVLKNRMLAISANSFDEKQLGFRRFLDFLVSIADVVAIDITRTPPEVTLTDRSRIDDRVRITDIGSRIRSDLWRAIVDYSSGDKWVWDPGSHQAIITDESDQRLAFSTLNESEIHELRKTFVASLGEQPNDILTSWVDSIGATAILPTELRGAWTSHLKQVVYDNLVSFFAENGIDQPSDLVRGCRESSRSAFAGCGFGQAPE